MWWAWPAKKSSTTDTSDSSCVTLDSGFPIPSSRLLSGRMLKALSLLGYLAMMGGLIGLLLTRSLVWASPLVIVPQVAAVALMIWARTTFGRRSFHLAAN